MNTFHRAIGLLVLASWIPAGRAAAAPQPAPPTPQSASQDADRKREEKLRALEAAVQEAPDDPSARRQLGMALLALGREDEASAQFSRMVELLQAVVEAAPNDLAARKRLAMALHDANRKEEAIPHLEKAVELKRNVRTLLDLGIAYAAVSRFGDAEKTYRSLLELRPGYPLALHNLGNVYYMRGDDENAIVYYRQAIAANPRYGLAYLHLGRSLNRLGHYREAYRSFETVLGFEPTKAQDLQVFDDALYEMASLDIKMGAHERAAELLETLIAENPNHETAYYAYGQVLIHLDRADEAQQAFEKHMEIQKLQKNTGSVAVHP